MRWRWMHWRWMHWRWMIRGARTPAAFCLRGVEAASGEVPSGPVAGLESHPRRYNLDTTHPGTHPGNHTHMTWTVEIEPARRSFSAEPTESLLEAALRQGVVLPYGCRDGACGSCKAKATGGTWEQGPHQSSALRADEKEQGYLLTCSSFARSDLRIVCRTVSAVADIPVRKMPCRVAAIQFPAPDVAVMRLQLPAAERLRYLAGQYLELLMRDGSRRAYSLAGAPDLAEQLELHIRHMPGGKFTDPLFGQGATRVKEKDVLRFEGPLGTFFLREDSASPIVLLASGTGFAPIKAIVEHIRLRDIRRPVSLYWGGRRPHDLYMRELCAAWQTELPELRIHLVVSDALPEDRWEGRSGFVHRAVMEDFPNLSGFEVYACGAPVMVDAARSDFVRHCGLAEEAFFADAFTSAADTSAVTPLPDTSAVTSLAGTSAVTPLPDASAAAVSS